jgi:hypothetical protein
MVNTPSKLEKKMKIPLGKSGPAIALLFLFGGLALALDPEHKMFGQATPLWLQQSVGAFFIVLGSFIMGGIINWFADQVGPK